MGIEEVLDTKLEDLFSAAACNLKDLFRASVHSGYRNMLIARATAYETASAAAGTLLKATPTIAYPIQTEIRCLNLRITAPIQYQRKA